MIKEEEILNTYKHLILENTLVSEANVSGSKALRVKVEAASLKRWFEVHKYILNTFTLSSFPSLEEALMEYGVTL